MWSAFSASPSVLSKFCPARIVLISADLIRGIKDPEHPLTLELNVEIESKVQVENENGTFHIMFTPPIPHCSIATLIGLSIRVKLLRSLPPRFKVDVQITPGTHDSEVAEILFYVVL